MVEAMGRAETAKRGNTQDITEHFPVANKI